MQARGRNLCLRFPCNRVQENKKRQGDVLAIPDNINSEFPSDKGAYDSKTNELVRMMNDVSPDGLLVIDDEQNIIYHNTQFSEMWYIPPALIQKESYLMLMQFIDDQIDSSKSKISIIPDTNDIVDRKQETIFLDDGRVFETHTCHLIREGKRVGHIWRFRDITSKKWHDDMPAISETSYKSLFHDAPIGIIRVETSGIISQANKPFMEILQHNEDDIVGRSFFDIVSEDMRESLEATFLAILEGKHEQHILDLEAQRILEVEFRSGSGEIRVCSMQFSIQQNAKGNPDCFVVTIIDITEQKRAEKLQKENEQRIQDQHRFLQTVLDSLTHPFYVIDANTYEIRIANKAANLDFGKSQKCHTHSHFSEEPCCNTMHPCPLEEVKRTRKPVSVEHIHVNPETGIEATYEVHGFPIFDENKNITQIIEYNWDITKRKENEKALQESEERYRTIFMEMAEGVGITDINDTILFANQGFANIIGDTASEMIGQRIINYVPDYEQQRIAAESEIRSDGMSSLYELDMQHRDGSIRSTRISAVPFRNHENEIIGSIAIVSDISELKIREQEYADLISMLPAGLAIADENEKLLLVNTAFSDMLNYSSNEIIGKSVLDFIHEDDKAIMNLQIELRKQKAATGYDIRMLTAQGELRDVHVDASPRVNKAGVIIGSVGVFQDVTQQRLIERRLENEQNRLKAITDANSDGIIMIDSSGIVRFWNPAATKIFGYSSEEAVGMNLHERLAPAKYIEDHLKAFKSYVRTGEGNAIGKTVELSGIRKDGTKFDLGLSMGAIPGNDGWEAVGNVRDITARKISEEIQQQQKAELEIYSSILRHDLRNDVGVILGNVDIAKAILEEDSPILDLMNSNEAVCERILELLRSFTRSEDEADSNLLPILERTAKLAEEINDNMEINLHLPKDITVLNVKVSRLLPMVFENLFRNAAVYSGRTPHIDVRVTLTEEHAIVRVSDDGPGVSEEIRDRLFQRGVTTAGTGLGLYLSKQIVSGIGGTIELADSERGEGAVFLIKLLRS